MYDVLLGTCRLEHTPIKTEYLRGKTCFYFRVILHCDENEPSCISSRDPMAFVPCSAATPPEADPWPFRNHASGSETALQLTLPDSGARVRYLALPPLPKNP